MYDTLFNLFPTASFDLWEKHADLVFVGLARLLAPQEGRPSPWKGEVVSEALLLLGDEGEDLLVFFATAPVKRMVLTTRISHQLPQGRPQEARPPYCLNGLQGWYDDHRP